MTSYGNFPGNQFFSETTYFCGMCFIISLEACVSSCTAVNSTFCSTCSGIQTWLRWFNLWQFIPALKSNEFTVFLLDQTSASQHKALVRFSLPNVKCLLYMHVYTWNSLFTPSSYKYRGTSGFRVACILSQNTHLKEIIRSTGFKNCFSLPVWMPLVSLSVNSELHLLSCSPKGYETLAFILSSAKKTEQPGGSKRCHISRGAWGWFNGGMSTKSLRIFNKVISCSLLYHWSQLALFEECEVLQKLTSQLYEKIFKIIFSKYSPAYAKSSTNG